MAKVKLAEVVDALDMIWESTTAYIDRQTGKVVELDEGNPYDDDDGPDDEQSELARLIEEDTEGRFVALPDKFDVNEWQMMADFAGSLEDDHAAASLSSTVRGSGAFRRFKDMVDALGYRDRWFAYRKERLRALAVEWCEGEGVEWEDEAA